MVVNDWNANVEDSLGEYWDSKNTLEWWPITPTVLYLILLAIIKMNDV
jgi:hypothetical protein